MRQQIKSKIVYKRRDFEITESQRCNEPFYWAYRLPYYENVKGFKDLKEAKNYINDLIKREGEKNQ
ncbi:unnamed protein product [marine sediment metagenome]|uniref:Uncharacterized protein n=1 Tax=marine sediment metagenome TaxID=412755 RepID=X1GAZ6_9ZZZZ